MTQSNVTPEQLFQKRILQEAAVMRELFGSQFRLRRSGERWQWVGEAMAEGQRVPVVVLLSPHHPFLPPELMVGVEVPAGCPHVLGRTADGLVRICWIDPGAWSGSRRRWDPARHTAATVVLAAQRWVIAMLVWRATGDWPVADAWLP